MLFVVGDKYEENLDEHGGFVNVMSSGTKMSFDKGAGKKYIDQQEISMQIILILSQMI